MKSIFVCAFAGLCIVGCNTTNSMMRLSPDYSEVPESELRVIATEIETIVSGGEAEFELANSGGIVVERPDMRQAIRTRALRHELVSALLDTGFAVEERSGLIAITRNSAYKKATTSRQRDREAMLVMSENGNRWTLYEGLVESNGWSPRSLSAVQEVFFQSRVPLMTPGQRHGETE